MRRLVSGALTTITCRSLTLKDTGGDNMHGGFSIDNISKHLDSPYDGGCRNCGDEGHFARDYPEPRSTQR
ncbi:hypothetical protein AC578_1287 [Pseudocercospora eumusae]|uniref:CCHC-type domain-containing protein n=1 Tax=Pseudocercospora eumusae TaxID=321146 RepID=A0A139HUH5_9PEZI|nr:hypothetical protein AC578_1287 [Pseudocercospora eumusae]